MDDMQTIFLSQEIFTEVLGMSIVRGRDREADFEDDAAF